MQMQMDQSLKQAASQKMIQSAQILQLNTAELRQYLQELALENPLMEGREQEFLDAIWNVIGNISFRKFEGDHIENPLIEFMDEVYVVDRKGNSHYSIVTDITYTFYGATNIKNSAESAARISSSYGNPNTSTEKKLHWL